jgi:pyruvate kinase
MGPSTRSVDILLKMFHAGMKIIRFNFSHGTFEEYAKDFALINLLHEKYNINVKKLIDLEGHRIRIGKLKDKQVILTHGNKLTLTSENIIGTSEKIYIDYHNSFTDIKEGFKIFVDDGNLTLKVICSTKNEIITVVQNNYLLKECKGVNIPQANLKFDKFEQRDLNGINFALQYNVDFIANSFVRNANDMKPLINILKQKKNTSCKLIAKIEDQDGIDNINDILKISDGIMVARGDLGISIPIWTLPMQQKHIIQKCNIYNKFTIVATQILESMIHKSIPTRAEVSDIANAVLDGANYVMFSAETAIGEYPVEVVKVTKNVIDYTIKAVSKKWK